jgi:hypothetical protein
VDLPLFGAVLGLGKVLLGLHLRLQGQVVPRLRVGVLGRGSGLVGIVNKGELLLVVITTKGLGLQLAWQREKGERCVRKCGAGALQPEDRRALCGSPSGNAVSSSSCKTQSSLSGPRDRRLSPRPVPSDAVSKSVFHAVRL